MSESLLSPLENLEQTLTAYHEAEQALKNAVVDCRNQGITTLEILEILGGNRNFAVSRSSD